MIADVVVDTNVLAHADNPNEAEFEDSVAFLEKLVSVEVALCLDEPRHRDLTRSRIIGEYRKTIAPNGLSAAVLARILSSGRAKPVSPRVTRHVRSIINRLVRPEKALDRLLLAVAYGSDDRVVTSHDDEDFNAETRDRAHDELDVRVVDAREALLLLG